MKTSRTCFHCNLPVPEGVELSVDIEGEARPMCCHGCAAVARAIVDSGNESFYRFRTESSPTARELVPEFLREARVFDRPDIQSRFAATIDEHTREASLIIEGIVCAACVWLNENYLRGIPGIHDVQINYATHRALVRWDNRRIRLSEIIEAVSRIGYLAHPYEPDRHRAILERQRKGMLRRLGIAGLLGAQVMMFSVAMYAGDWWGMEEQYRRYFSWISLLLTLPVLTYSGQPFFAAAWRDLRRRRAGMDVPVSLGISIAFLASAWHTLHGDGALYFDSVVMFVFLLLGARYLELGARRRAVAASERVFHAVPATALRLAPETGEEDVVAVADLVPGDTVLVRPGETIPADGLVLQGNSRVSEALLTGEESPRSKRPGDRLIGGSVNTDSPVQMRVEKTGADTILAGVQRLMLRAQNEKPEFALLADRIAGWFVVVLLVFATAVAVFWYSHDPGRWLPVTISVLVVTCPCALSLATPAALAAATGNLLCNGLLTTRAHALETLARCTDFVLDKTGTLTEGKPKLMHTLCIGELDQATCLRLAASLAFHSEHPASAAIAEAAAGLARWQVTDVESVPGAGIKGRIDNRTWFLGSAAFVAGVMDQAARATLRKALSEPGATVVYLADETGVRGAFELADRLRPAAGDLVRWFDQHGIRAHLLSGDRSEAVSRLGGELGITDAEGDLTPADKVRRVKRLQADGAIVGMAGDGINDAPVLAQAHVSVAMGSGSNLAANSADMILLSNRLPGLAGAIGIARKTMSIIRENLLWAVGYNLFALPAAALGWLEPWMAAIGMSASSLIVVGNSLRLTRNNLADWTC